PAQPGALYRYWRLRFVTRGRHALGVAGHALETVIALAATKQPTGSTDLLRDDARTRSQVAEARTLLGAARAWLVETTASVWQTLCAGEMPTPTQRADLALATNNAVWSAVRATELAYHLGGTTAIDATSVLNRCWRDVNTAAADLVVNPRWAEAAGAVYLGLPP